MIKHNLKLLKIILTVFTLLLVCSPAVAQFENLDVKLGQYRFSTEFDTSNYLTTLKIRKGSSTVFNKTSEYGISGISEQDLDNDGMKEILIDLYSGGAHCCNFLIAARMTDDEFSILDTLFWGNAGYKIEDLEGNQVYEIVGLNDQFAYAFTNYAQSAFNSRICGFKDNKFIDITGNFPDIVEGNIRSLKEELAPYTTDSGFACPVSVDEDTFNTDAGAVKAILAPIVADYVILGRSNEGYAYVDSIYKCPDANAFKDTLKVVYGLK